MYSFVFAEMLASNNRVVCLKNIPQRRWEWCRLTICVHDQIVKSLKLANVSNCLSTSSATTHLLSYKNSLTASILEQISVIKS